MACNIIKSSDGTNTIVDASGNPSALYDDLLQLLSNYPYTTSELIPTDDVNNLALQYYELSNTPEFRNKYNLTSKLDVEVSIDDIINHINTEYSFNETQEVKEGIYPYDRIIWGHPAIGKTTAKKERDFLDFDTDFKPLVAKILGLPESQQNSIGLNEWRKTGSEEDFNKAMREVWEIAKSDAFIQNKRLLVSDMIFLRENQSDFDKVINIPTSTFINRAIQRGDSVENLQNWKNNIDKVLTTIDSNKIITTDKYLSDLFITQEQGIKEGVEDLFESNPKLSSIGTQEQYSQYLDTIFPNSKVKDIVYHGSSIKKLEEIDKRFYVTYYTNNIEYVKSFNLKNKYISAAIVNINNPLYTNKPIADALPEDSTYTSPRYTEDIYDSVIGKDAGYAKCYK